MTRRKRRKPAIAERRKFIGGGVVLVLGILNNGLGIVERLWSWRRAPGVVVDAVGTAAGRSSALALSGVEAVTVVESVSVTITPWTGQMI